LKKGLRRRNPCLKLKSKRCGANHLPEAQHQPSIMATSSRVTASLQAQLRDLRAKNFALRFAGVCKGVEELSDRYDGFILDQW
jgi:hypothetical protein